MSPNLSRPQKINKYAQEPLAFHIYKNRRFFNKIEIPKTIVVKDKDNPLNRKIRKIKANNVINDIHLENENINQTINIHLNNESDSLKPSIENPYLLRIT